MTRAMRVFHGEPTDTALWEGDVGPKRERVRINVERDADGRPRVVVAARVCPVGGDPCLAICLEHDDLVFGRFAIRGDDIVLEVALLGGETLSPREVQLAAWWVGWATAAFRDRLQTRMAGGAPTRGVPEPPATVRRGVEERIASSEELVSRYLAERFGSFERDPHWGHHAGFGSARVFVSVRHLLESSTAILVASPVLSGVELGPALARRAVELVGHELALRVAFAVDRAELWFESTVLGDDLDADELDRAVRSVAHLSDEHDDALQAEFGGHRYRDLAG